MRNTFYHYLTGVSLAALAMGCQIVLLPWLAVGELNLAAEQVGWVQSLSLFPSVVLLLIGGSFADRNYNRMWLPLFYLVLASSHVIMSTLLILGSLQLNWLLAYALLLGISSAFIQPLRERLLPRLLNDKGSLQQSIVIMSLCLYMAQAIGVAVAGQLDTVGTQWILLGQTVLLVLTAGVFFFWVRPQTTSLDVAPQTVGITDGLRVVWHNKVLRNLILLVGFNGFMNIGLFVVALPLLARDGYQQGAVYFASLQLCFVLGNIAATLGLLKRGKAQHPGRAVLFCLLYSGVLMLAVSAKPTLNGLFGLVFFWGVVSGVSASLGKGLLQQQAPEQYRGRIVSIYQLALFGAAPIGALVCGYVVSYFGPWQLFMSAGVISVLVFVVYGFSRTLWAVNVAPNANGEIE